MTPAWRILAILLPAVWLAAPAMLRADDTAPAEQIEFFESKVRPLIAEKCFGCHSAQAKVIQGGLKLDSRAAVIKGGDSGPAVVAGKPAESNLIQAVLWQSFEMPPKGKLREDEVAVLTKWVELGAPWPVETAQVVEPAATYDWSALRAKHWAWQPVRQPAPPTVQNKAWPTNEIDHFILAKLEATGLTPAEPADPRTLIRRLYFDLVGLPPSTEEVAAFVANHDEAAYAALVERLLASPQYGQRWARHWLDVARYSDGYGGFLDAAGLANAWRYRDWVVNSLNGDLPLDEFVRRQIAGDLIGREHAVATGFLALGPTYISDGGDPDAAAQAQSETLDDRVDTVSRGLLGVTVSCARCHDHKFDPIPQLDYYSLAGVFFNTKLGELPLGPEEVVKKSQAHQKEVGEREKKIREMKLAARQDGRKLTDDEKKIVDQLQAEVDELKKNAPPGYDLAHVMADNGNRDMNLAIRGNLRKPGPVAPRRFLRIVAGDEPPRFTQGSGRLDLAAALVSPDNPLTSRVLVNRIWYEHFGAGIVRTLSNFGTAGEKPSHPELLDWLAADLMSGDSSREGRWSLKRLHRQIVRSATYRMASTLNEKAFGVDGDNRLLWRFIPRRLDVEAWRDALLSATGEIDLRLGGPSEADLLASSRRTLYASISRNGDRFSSDAFLRLFDFPPPRGVSEGRTSSIVPQQFLFMLNSPFMAARAKALAKRLAGEMANDSERIDRAYELLYSRPVTADERELGLSFLAMPRGESKGQLSAWEQYAQVLLSANELMFVK